MRRVCVWPVLGVLTLVVSAPNPVNADVRLPAVVSDHMVLQQGKPASIWGWADPGEKVNVSVSGQTASAVTDANGDWRVRLEPLQAGGPVTVTIQGKNTIQVNDVLIGEVWICSGQSNMAMTVGRSANAKDEIAAANWPKIRLFSFKRQIGVKPMKDVKGGKWAACSPKSVPGFSAAGYFFGREIHKVLDVPIGLVNTSWGGTRAESWTSRSALDAQPILKNWLTACDRQAAKWPALEPAFRKKQAEYRKVMRAYYKARKAGEKPKRPKRLHTPMGPESSGLPAGLFNGMVSPLLPMTIRGAIWYQGEANSSRPEQYRTVFPAMITDWRRHWGCEFPFLFVQLAAYEAGARPWPFLREAQTMTLKTPNTGMALAIDIGMERDIHPKNKQEVGRRLALAAQALVYGKKVVYSGPMYKAMTVEGAKARLSFAHVHGGLVAKGGALQGFTVAGADKKFVKAEARINGDDVIVSSPQVAGPVAVRYAWANFPTCNLYNAEGLPACPFRTDDWPRPESKSRKRTPRKKAR